MSVTKLFYIYICITQFNIPFIELCYSNSANSYHKQYRSKRKLALCKAWYWYMRFYQRVR